jgi:hypothetical protein
VRRRHHFIPEDAPLALGLPAGLVAAIVALSLELLLLLFSDWLRRRTPDSEERKR